MEDERKLLVGHNREPGLVLLHAKNISYAAYGKADRLVKADERLVQPKVLYGGVLNLLPQDHYELHIAHNIIQVTG